MTVPACPACGSPCGEFDPTCPRCGAPLASAGPGAAGRDDPLLGRQVSHFRIEALLGRGGMGVVYRATDLALGRPVALKFLAGGALDPAEDLRLRREAQAAAALDHPNIGVVHEIGEHAGQRFLVMAFYDGETLASRLARGPLALEEALAVMVALAAALAAAHAVGLIHRDVKPANVMIAGGGRVKLLDFGVARRLDAPAQTASGMAPGTLAYMAPELLRGEAAGVRSDLWSAGVVLYEMLAGFAPFRGRAGRGIVEAILYDEPPPLAAVRPGLPGEVAEIVHRCLAKDSPARFADARALLAELAPLAPTLRHGFPVGALRPRSAPRRWAWAAATAAALSVAALVLLRAAPPRPETVVVVALAPRVTGVAGAEESALVAANLQEAALRALTALDGVAAVDPAQLRGIPAGSPAQVARAVAAGELIETEARCAGDLCRVAVRRLDGAGGRVIRTVGLELPLSDPRLFAEGTALGVRRDYPERALRWESLDLAVDADVYDRYLDLRRRVNAGRTSAYGELLAEADALRRRAPGFVELAALESGLDRYLYATTRDARNLDQGLAVARQAEHLAPDDPRPPASRFDLALAGGRLAEAETALAALDRLERGTASAEVRRARLLEARGQPREAIARLERVVARQPSWQYLLVLANLEYRQGRLDRARGALESLLARSPGNLQGLRTLAQIELLNGDPARAAALLAGLTASRPAAGDLTNLGLAQLLLRRYGEAEASLRRARALSPADPQPALDLADCLWLAARRDEARRAYQEVLALTAEGDAAASWTAASARAQALAHLGRSTEAVEAIQRALRSSPDNAQLALEAALVYAVLGEPSSALFHAGRALASGVGRRWFDLSWFDGIRARLPAAARS